MAVVPLSSWQVGPWNRWAYQHVQEVVPTVPVRCDPARHRDLPVELSLTDLGEELRQTAYVDGVAVLRDGVFVLERYADGMEPDTLHLSQSVGKSVLGLLVGILAEGGVLDPKAQVTEYVPEVAGSGYERATIQHLLDMTAAIDFVEDYAGDFWRYDIACGWHPPHPDVGAKSILEFLPTIGPASWRHGQRFHYATPNTDLLGFAAERASGTPLGELIARDLWTPLGPEFDAQITVDPAGTAAIGGGFCATLRDYTRLGALVAENGRGIVPQSWVARLGEGDPSAFADTTSKERSGADGYSNQWWRRDGRPTARGIHGQLITVDRSANVVITILSSWPDATDAELEMKQRQFVADVCARYLDQ